MQPRARLSTVLAAAAVLACGLCAAELDLTFFVHRLLDLDYLPYVEKGETSRQFSSYDRRSQLGPNGEKIGWDANADAGQYLRVEPNGEAVMAEMDGPGVITQIWSANPQGKLHFYIDGAATPIVFDFTAFTTGGIPQIPPALSTKGGGAGVNCYLPIPYATRCAVKADKAHNQYYHVDYTTFPAGTRVRSFAWPLTDAEKAAVASAAAWLDKKCGEDPSPRPDATTIAGEAALPAGTTATIAKLDGPGVVTRLAVKLEGESRGLRRDVMLRAFWDNAEKPAIEAPYGDFFASTWASVPFRSLPIGMTEAGGYCYWRMPFAKNARLELANEGAADAKVAFEVVWARAEWKDNAAYLHAKWRREAPNKVFDWPLLSCKGRGRFVGVQLSVQNPDPPWFGEGDEKVYVDGEKFPSWFGTGTEDYFCDAWGFRPFIQFSHGCPMYHEPGRTTVYRWHTLDNIPFAESFDMTIENYGNNKDYSAVAFWYAAPQNRDFFTTPAREARRVWPMRLPYVIEAEDTAAPGAAVVDDSTTPCELSGGKGLALAPGKDAVTLKIAVQAKDAYRFSFFGPGGRESAGFEARIGEEIVAAAGTNAFQRDGKIVCPARRVLEKGMLELTVRAVGAGERVLLDALRLEPSPHVARALEAEILPVATSPNARADVSYVLTDDAVSGCALRVITAPEGEWVEIALPGHLCGTFNLSMRVSPGPTAGAFAATCAGAKLSAVDATKPETLALGTAALPGGDGNRLRLTCTRAPRDDNAELGIDYFLLVPVIAEGAIEAEKLKILAERDTNSQLQALGEQLSGEVHRWCPGRQGQFIDLELPVKEAGTYALVIYFVKAADYGIVEVELDGKPVGGKVNCYSNGVAPSGGIGLGDVTLAAGNHTLTFRCREKDERSINYFMGIDCLTLRKKA